MAVDVTIKSGGLFKKKLTIQDVLTGNIRYGIMDEAFRLEEGKVGENTVVFNADSICRGYEIALEKTEVNLRLPLPTSPSDIAFFYQQIEELCQKLNTKTFIRNGEKTTFTAIDNCKKLDTEASIAALRQIEEDITNGKYENMYIFGALNPIAIGKKEIKEIAGDIDKFAELMNKLQSMDVYYAKPKVYQRNDNTYFGVYVLTENVPSVLPTEPKLLMANTDLKVNDWNIGFVANNKLEGFISYSDFLDSVKRTEDYDSEHFIVRLEAKKMGTLLKKYRVDL